MSEQVKPNIFSVSDSGILSETTEVKVDRKSVV